MVEPGCARRHGSAGVRSGWRHPGTNEEDGGRRQLLQRSLAEEIDMVELGLRRRLGRELGVVAAALQLRLWWRWLGGEGCRLGGAPAAA
jgi:hypothetical protein